MYNKYVLQYRWKVIDDNEQYWLIYYGVRNPPFNKDTKIKISSGLAKNLLNQEYVSYETTDNEVNDLIKQNILVNPESKKQAKTIENMQVCKTCIANDYIIPGLEFNSDGVCALCQCYEQAEESSSSVLMTITEEELVNALKENASGFDVMLFYTGGKDSSYLLWLLAKKLKLRVLAVFWNMPYSSSASYDNIIQAKKYMNNVEFIEWTLPLEKVHKAMKYKWEKHGWPCLCPNVAFPLFYPLAFNKKIPYIFMGLEDIQASALDYVVAKSINTNSRTPRDKTLDFLSVRSIPRNSKFPILWQDEMANHHALIRESLPELYRDLAEIIHNAQNDESINIPLITRLSTNENYGEWTDVKELLKQEMGWKSPENQNNLLHTSCDLEPVKDYLQFIRFKEMRTVFMPQSIVELSAAVFFGLTKREEALDAVRELGYWSVPDKLNELIVDLDITEDDLNKETELSRSLNEYKDNR